MTTNHSLDVMAPAPARRRATGRPALLEHLRRLHANTALFLTLARDAGIDTVDSAGAPMIWCVIGSSNNALRLSDVLMRRGINADLMLFPVVPEDKAGLRFFVTSCHSEEEIRFMITALAEELELLNPGN